jgi:type IV pilus assembly protein PilY1
MKTRLLSMVLLLATVAISPADAAVDLNRCESHLSENKHPLFSPLVFTNMDAIEVTSDIPAKLRLNTNTGVLNPEKGIFFPFDQDVSISYIYESAGASHSLGWVYYDDLVAAGYINQNGTLTDSSDDTLIDSDATAFPTSTTTSTTPQRRARTSE